MWNPTELDTTWTPRRRVVPFGPVPGVVSGAVAADRAVEGVFLRTPRWSRTTPKKPARPVRVTSSSNELVDLLACGSEGVRQAPRGPRSELLERRLEMVVSAPRQVLGRIQLAFDQRLVDDDLGGNITWLSGWPRRRKVPFLRRKRPSEYGGLYASEDSQISVDDQVVSGST